MANEKNWSQRNRLFLRSLFSYSLADKIPLHHQRNISMRPSY